MRKMLLTLLLMTSTMVHALSIKTAYEEKTSTISYPVGELGEQWVLPSDHLPVGATVGNIHFVMWNILSSHALHYIEDNGQGLRDSFIMAANIPTDDEDGLTLREMVIIDNIMEMIEHPTHPRSVLALEEVTLQVYNKLKKILPSNMAMLPYFSQDVFIYDQNVFKLWTWDHLKYANSSKNTITNLFLREKSTGILYCFVQSHVPGGPAVNSLPARVELSEAILGDFNPKAIKIVVGDMNRSPDYFMNNFAETARELDIEQPFQNLPVPYPTHINTHQEASWIDNIFIYNPYTEIPCQVSEDGSEFFNDLQRTIDLLKHIWSAAA